MHSQSILFHPLPTSLHSCIIHVHPYLSVQPPVLHKFFIQSQPPPFMMRRRAPQADATWPADLPALPTYTLSDIHCINATSLPPERSHVLVKRRETHYITPPWSRYHHIAISTHLTPTVPRDKLAVPGSIARGRKQPSTTPLRKRQLVYLVLLASSSLLYVATSSFL